MFEANEETNESFLKFELKLCGFLILTFSITSLLIITIILWISDSPYKPINDNGISLFAITFLVTLALYLIMYKIKKLPFLFLHISMFLFGSSMNISGIEENGGIFLMIVSIIFFTLNYIMKFKE